MVSVDISIAGPDNRQGYCKVESSSEPGVLAPVDSNVTVGSGQWLLQLSSQTGPGGVLVARNVVAIVGIIDSGFQNVQGFPRYSGFYW
ncbi:uncharacterized protein ACLA_021690 [Aspergillus clavatus NRRL 1]|uniref:Uncharacterized protein n=1 Tax=Aspergillus clavatus (strain ATCC 1007 / CBS 513.65 / DSM 816 / NCTC 3887 / NRRL 1 / QM 1276 / 107) TaxID=344612 RepID=A1CP84_ASPCL|nr:uncharacterized protein ACLA_021690 [Aspergillus clavatus NRRL 1]EAW07455.1 hypothetical protein ACLA_021690 [Aspergillus clavatus NRRL 1]